MARAGQAALPGRDDASALADAARATRVAAVGGDAVALLRALARYVALEDPIWRRWRGTQDDASLAGESARRPRRARAHVPVEVLAAALRAGNDATAPDSRSQFSCAATSDSGAIDAAALELAHTLARAGRFEAAEGVLATRWSALAAWDVGGTPRVARATPQVPYAVRRLASMLSSAAGDEFRAAALAPAAPRRRWGPTSDFVRDLRAEQARSGSPLPRDVARAAGTVRVRVTRRWLHDVAMAAASGWTSRRPAVGRWVVPSRRDPVVRAAMWGVRALAWLRLGADTSALDAVTHGLAGLDPRGDALHDLARTDLLGLRVLLRARGGDLAGADADIVEALNIAGVPRAAQALLLARVAQGFLAAGHLVGARRAAARAVHLASRTTRRDDAPASPVLRHALLVRAWVTWSADPASMAFGPEATAVPPSAATIRVVRRDLARARLDVNRGKNGAPCAGPAERASLDLLDGLLRREAGGLRRVAKALDRAGMGADAVTALRAGAAIRLAQGRNDLARSYLRDALALLARHARAVDGDDARAALDPSRHALADLWMATLPARPTRLLRHETALVLVYARDASWLAWRNASRRPLAPHARAPHDPSYLGDVPLPAVGDVPARAHRRASRLGAARLGEEPRSTMVPALRDGERAASWLLVGERLHVAVYTPDDVQVRTVPWSADDAAHVATLRALGGEEGAAWPVPAARALRAAALAALAARFLAPIEGSLAGASHLHVAPPPALVDLPLAALPWRGEPLVACIGVTHVLSLADLCQREGGQALFSPRGWTIALGTGTEHPLEGARAEVTSLATRVESVVLTHAHELRTALRTPSGLRVLHVAAHASRPARAWLGGTLHFPDGVVSAANLVQADLTELDLAMLVACNSGAVPDGLVGADLPHGGFVRALALAGARAVLCAHGPIADASAAAFVAHFVDAWTCEGRDLVAAFGAAQRARAHDDNAYADLALYLLRP